VAGRDFAMDREGRWDIVSKAYHCLTEGVGNTFKSASAYIAESYQKGFTDEFIEPACLAKGLPAQAGRIESGDAVIFYNFREDSVRELTSAFVSDAFSGFPREKIKSLFFVTMTEYDERFSVRVAFPPLDVPWPLSRVVSDGGFRQLHVAETEKYAHVTYFFNGGKENPYANEERILVPSSGAHYDEAPEMSASNITGSILENISKQDFILANFANGDMVGHTGNFDATIKALEVLDESLGIFLPRILEAGGALVITSDHGNAEEKIYSISGEKRTKHTSNPVPFFVVASSFFRKTPLGEEEINQRYSEVGGMLTDVAPTIIELMGLRKPADMTGISLLPKILEQ